MLMFTSHPPPANYMFFAVPATVRPALTSSTAGQGWFRFYQIKVMFCFGKGHAFVLNTVYSNIFKSYKTRHNFRIVCS